MRGSPRSRMPGRAACALLLTSAAATAHAQGTPRAIPPAIDIALRGKPAMRVFTDKDGLPQNTVAAQAFDADGRLWVGTQEGLAFYDGHAFQPVPFPDGGPQWVAQAVMGCARR